MYLSVSFGGNVHQAMGYVNTLKCAIYLFQVVALDSSCILIFKVYSREDRVAARVELGLSPEVA